MAVECKWYHTRLAELFATKKGKSYATTITFLHCTNYDWNHTVTLHNFQTPFNSCFRSWLVLMINILFHGVKWTSNINNQALLFFFIQYRLVVFNLVVNLYFEVPQHLVSGFIHWLWIMAVVSGFIHWLWIMVAQLLDSYMYTGCSSCNTCICHPCHTPAFHIQNKSQWIICTILSSLQHQYCFWASCLHFNTIWQTAYITFSAILHFAGTFCLSMVLIILVLKAWSCAAIIISSISIFSQLSFFQSLPSLYISYFCYVPPKLPMSCFSWKCSSLSCCNDAALNSQLLAYHLRTAHLYTAFL